MMPTLTTLAIMLLVIVIVAIIGSMIKIVKEYERAVIFRLGRLIGAKGPGLFIRIPGLDTFKKVDMRVITIDVPRQTSVTKDNVTVTVDAVVYLRVFDPVLAVTKVEQYLNATNLMAQTTLRDVLGQVELDELLAKREELGKRVSNIVDELTDPWGVKVTAVTLREVVLPESMTRALARQAEADREKRSRVIIAEGALTLENIDERVIPKAAWVSEVSTLSFKWNLSITAPRPGTKCNLNWVAIE